MNSVGLTGVGDAGVSAHEVALYRELADQGRLSVRIYAMIRGTGEDFAALSAERPLIGYGERSADRALGQAVRGRRAREPRRRAIGAVFG